MHWEREDKVDLNKEDAGRRESGEATTPLLWCDVGDAGSPMLRWRKKSGGGAREGTLLPPEYIAVTRATEQKTKGTVQCKAVSDSGSGRQSDSSV